MAGHRDDGSFAEDKAHHPNRKVHREMFVEPDQANPLGMVRPSTNAIPDAHDPGNLGEANHDARLRNALVEHMGISDDQAQDLLHAHRSGSVEEVYGGSSWDWSPEDIEFQNKVTAQGSIKNAIEGAINHVRMSKKHGSEWSYNPESSWSKRG